MTPTKALADKINVFVQKNGLNHLKVFGDLLDYIIAWFDPERKPISGWIYTAEQDVYFKEIMYTYLSLQNDQLAAGAEWYDAWGDLFMDMVGNFAGYRGQFFTPEPLCACMAELIGQARTSHKCNAFGERTIVNDPACGSSRTLLATNAAMLKEGKAQPYLIGEDLDHLCVKMSAINMCVHGCFGETVCHNSIEEAGSVSFGYIINEGLYPFPGLPTIRRFEDPEKFICCRPWFKKR